MNAAKDATELVAKLRAYHHTAQTKADKQHLSRYHTTLRPHFKLCWCFIHLNVPIRLYICVLTSLPSRSMGLDLSKGTVRNNLEAGVIEPAMSKVKIIQVGDPLFFCYLKN